MTDKSLELFEAIARFDSYYVVLEKDLPEVYALLGQPSAVLPRGRGRTTYIVAKTRQKSRDPFLGQDRPGRPHLARKRGRVRGTRFPASPRSSGRSRSG